MTLHDLGFLGIACVVGFALAPSSAAAGARSGGLAQSAGVDAPGERRIFVYTDGRVVRGIARATASGYEIAQGGAWRAVETAGLASARTEAEVFADQRTLAGNAPENHLGQRTELAAWMLSAGLVGEGLAELDRILGFVPNFQPAIEILARSEAKLDWPARAATDEAERAALIRRGASSGSRAEREIVAARLARERSTDGGREGLEKELAADLVSNVITRRAFAAHALGRILPGTSGPELLRRAVLDPAAEVRKSAAIALANVKDPAVTIPVSRCLASRSLVVRCHAAEALGEMGYEEAVPELIARVMMLGPEPVLPAAAGGEPRQPRAHIAVTGQTAYVQDFNLEIAQGASIADPIIAVQDHGAVLDVRVIGTYQVNIADELRRDANALRRLTGARLPDDPKRWAAWWEENRARYEKPAAEPDKGATAPASTGPR